MMASVSNNAEHRRGEVIASAARDWIGTPYRHQGSCRGRGADCLGLVRGVWREVIGAEPEATPVYTRDWSELSRTEDLLEAAGRNFDAVAQDDMIPGDVVVMRMRTGATAKHVGILGRSPDGYLTLIHAYSGHGVVESPLAGPWLKKIAGVFRFPKESI